jgi:hypothetical protein
MEPTSKKITLKFTAYKEFEISYQDDPSEALKTFCEDHDLEFEDHSIVSELYQCPKCDEYFDKLEAFEDGRGNEHEVCQSCLCDWSDAEFYAVDEDHYRGDR